MVAVAALCAFPAAANDEAADTVAGYQVHLPFRTVNSGDMLGGAEVLDLEKLMEVNYINDINNGTISGYVSGFTSPI